MWSLTNSPCEMLEPVYISVGTNLGDRVQNVIDARQAVRALSGVKTLSCSSLYLSSPVGFAEQADFINCVLELSYTGTPEALFAGMQAIENALGRTRDPKNQNAPRVIDLDLLIFADIKRTNDQQQENTAQKIDLIIPHPRLSERLFVLEPLFELNSMLDIVGQGSVADILRDGKQQGHFNDQTIIKLGR